MMMKRGQEMVGLHRGQGQRLQQQQSLSNQSSSSSCCLGSVQPGQQQRQQQMTTRQTGGASAGRAPMLTARLVQQQQARQLGRPCSALRPLQGTAARQQTRRRQVSQQRLLAVQAVLLQQQMQPLLCPSVCQAAAPAGLWVSQQQVQQQLQRIALLAPTVVRLQQPLGLGLERPVRLAVLLPQLLHHCRVTWQLQVLPAQQVPLRSLGRAPQHLAAPCLGPSAAAAPHQLLKQAVAPAAAVHPHRQRASPLGWHQRQRLLQQHLLPAALCPLALLLQLLPAHPASILVCSPAVPQLLPAAQHLPLVG
jgi:hypothetical protein